MNEKTKKGQTTPLVPVAEKISINLIDTFSNHPYHVADDDDMFELIESIRKKRSDIAYHRKAKRRPV